MEKPNLTCFCIVFAWFGADGFKRLLHVASFHKIEDEIIFFAAILGFRFLFLQKVKAKIRYKLSY